MHGAWPEVGKIFILDPILFNDFSFKPLLYDCKALIVSQC